MLSVLYIIAFIFFSGIANGVRLPDIYWNSTNPIFRIDNTDHIINVNEYDQVNIVCPFYGKIPSDNMESYVIYNVSEKVIPSFENIFILFERLLKKSTTPVISSTERWPD